MDVAGTWHPTAVTKSAPEERGVSRLFAWPVWGLYLFLAALLAAVLKPVGPGQLAILDGVNLAALVLFLSAVVLARQKIEMPLLVPVLIISAGSLLAMTNVISASGALLTMAQDAYLYLWFVFLVNIMRARGTLRGFRIAWVWAGVIIALVGLALLFAETGQSFGQIFAAKGERAVGLTYGPNTQADYLVASIFVALSLAGQVRRIWLWPAIVVMAIGLVATKSNGAMGSLAAGVLLWGILRLFMRSGSRVGIIAGVLLLVGIAGIGWRAASESRLLAPGTPEAAEESFLGRVERSSKSRAQIWERLSSNFEKTPLGIGPGNSKYQHLGVASRERKDSYMSKEAHNDYLAYVIERGPIGLAGLLLLTAACFWAVWKGWKSGKPQPWQKGRGGAIAAALMGGMLATAIHSLVMETLHFRHFWMFIALFWGIRAPSAEPSALAIQGNGHGTASGIARRRIRLGAPEPAAHN